MRLYAILAGGERADWAALDPFSPHVGTKVVLPYFFYLIEHPQGRVLFDTGAQPSLASDPRSRLGDEDDNWEILMTENDGVVPKLAELGVRAEDIDHVVLSHLHYDHCGGIEFLPNAVFHVQRAELEFARKPPVYQAGLYVPADFGHPVNWHEIDGDHDLFGDRTVRIIATTGHTPGHQSLLAQLPGQPIILVGDAAYLPETMAARHLPSVVWRPDEMVASWERLENLATETGAQMLFTHDIGYQRNLRTAPDFYA